MTATVLSAGYLATVQDCGRFGFRKYGVTTAGALDPTSLRLANLLVGNDECAAGLEIVSGRVSLRFNDERLVAWAGGDFEVCIMDQTIPKLHCARSPTDMIIEIAPRRGGRAWLAVSGGIDVPVTLDSRSTDLRARFGGWNGRALQEGDILPLGQLSTTNRQMARQLSDGVSNWSAPVLSLQKNILRAVCGRNWEDFSEAVRTKFLADTFTVALNSDRMGLRLQNGKLASPTREFVSEAVSAGTIQLPRGGAAIVLLADCQTIGGYPKIAHVITVDLACAAQLQPLDQIRFELVTLAAAEELLLARERDIALFRAGLQARFG